MSRRNEQDFIAWYPEKQGLFTVKSAYKLALERKMQEQGTEATSTWPDGARLDWHTIWKNPAPPKVKMLAWKICRNGLATKDNMARRGMRTSNLCQICGQDPDIYARLQVQRFVEQHQLSLKWTTQGLSNSGRKRSKLSLSNNPAITIQKVSCVPNTPNTLVKCIGALVWRRDSEIQVVVMIISSKCNLK
jgi:hypothetical protein